LQFKNWPLVNQANHITKAKKNHKITAKIHKLTKRPFKQFHILFKRPVAMQKLAPLVTQANYITKTEKVVKSQKNTPTISAI